MRSFSITARALAGAFALLLACVMAGTIAVPYGAWVGDGLIRIVVLPAVVMLLFLFILDKTKLFLMIILIRAPVDAIIEATRSGGISIGASMNALVLLIAILLAVERPRAALRVVLPMWGPLLVMLLVATAKAPDLGVGIKTCLAYFTYAAVFAVPFYVKDCQKDMRFCVYLVLLSSVIPALYGFVDFAHGGNQTGGLAGRIQSTLSHPNIFAFYLVLVISLAFYMIKSPAMNASWTQRCLLAAYIGVLLVLLVLTKTRSAWAACLVVFLVYGILFERRYLIYLALGSWVALLIPEVQDRLLDAMHSRADAWGNPQNSFQWRTMIWESGLSWMRLKDMPLGYGLASFAYYSLDFFRLAGGLARGAHNVYVQWFFEAGIVGVACAAWLFYRLLSILRMGMARDKLGTVLLMTVAIEYLVVSYSDNMLEYLSFNWYFWFVMGTACAVALASGDAVQASGQRKHGIAAGVPHRT